jgi:hypothetical protein
MSCNCLGFLNNQVYWDAAGDWMVDFGKLNKQERQRVVIKKIRHADFLTESIDAASQDPEKHLVFCLPFLMTAEPEDGDAIEDNGVSRLSAITVLNKHKICQSALMELISARKLWWGTCCKHLKNLTVPVHGLKGQPSKCKQKFRDEEEANLIEFFVKIKDFAEPSATRFAYGFLLM